MFSATFPRTIESLAKTILSRPVEIVVGNRGQTCANIDQHVETFEDESEKFLRLLEILGQWLPNFEDSGGSVLIFVEK